MRRVPFCLRSEVPLLSGTSDQRFKHIGNNSIFSIDPNAGSIGKIVYIMLFLCKLLSHYILLY